MGAVVLDNAYILFGDYLSTMPWGNLTWNMHSYILHLWPIQHALVFSHSNVRVAFQTHILSQFFKFDYGIRTPTHDYHFQYYYPNMSRTECGMIASTHRRCSFTCNLLEHDLYMKE